MKKLHSSAALALALLAGLGAGRSLAADPSETLYHGVVANSTYTFTNVGVSGPGDFNLDQTTLTNLNSAHPAVTLQLILTDITYTEGSVKGDGLAPTITFSLSPTLSNAGGNLASKTVTLTGPVIPNGTTETDVAFTLSSPVVFAAVDESNPGNTNTGTGTWQETVSNLEPSPDEIQTAHGSFNPNSVQNQDFSFDGTVEVFYEASPEPSTWNLLVLTIVGMVAFLYRRRNSHA